MFYFHVAIEVQGKKNVALAASQAVHHFHVN